MKDSAYLFSASICVTSLLFVTLLHTFLFSIPKGWFPTLNGKTLALDYAKKSQNLRLKCFFLLYLSQIFIFYLFGPAGIADNVGTIFIPHYFSFIEHTFVVQKVSAGGSVIEDSRSLQLTCGFIVRIKTNLSFKVLFWLVLQITTAIIKISKKKFNTGQLVITGYIFVETRVKVIRKLNSSA